MIRRHHKKTPYKLLHDKPPDLSYLHVFGALCYPEVIAPIPEVVAHEHAVSTGSPSSTTDWYQEPWFYLGSFSGFVVVI
ncbi:hypothetical protein Tco_0342669 [Tanacetum coccineum]